MTKLLLSLFAVFSVLSLSFAYLYVSDIAYPNTYLNKKNVSFLQNKKIVELLKQQYNKPIKLQIKDRVYTYTYKDLGIVLNESQSLSYVFLPNTARFPQNIISFFRSLRSQRVVMPVLIVTQDFYKITASNVYDFSPEPDKILVDNQDQKLTYQKNEEKYIIDQETLKKQLLYSFGTDTTLVAKLFRIDQSKEDIVAQQNKKIETLFQKPISIVIQDSEQTVSTVEIPTDQIKRLVKIDYQQASNSLSLNIDEKGLDSVIFGYLSPFQQQQDKKISVATITQDITSVIRSRWQGADANTLLAKIDTAPNTQGDRADKYIEVDISQQRMYLFQHGNIVAVQRVSTGLYYPTPVGEFKIKNKAVNAYSDIYHVWMPFWMAFYHSPTLNAYFGIHELPYWVSDNGEKIQRPREFIGSPHTGGCIALDVGVAKEVYQFAEVGMPVYVFE